MPKSKLFASIRLLKANDRFQASHAIENSNAQFIEDHQLSDIVVALTPELEQAIINAI